MVPPPCGEGGQPSPSCSRTRAAPFTALWRNSREEYQLGIHRMVFDIILQKWPIEALKSVAKYPKRNPGMRVRAALNLSRNAWRLSLSSIAAADPPLRVHSTAQYSTPVQYVQSENTLEKQKQADDTKHKPWDGYSPKRRPNSSSRRGVISSLLSPSTSHSTFFLA